MKEGIIVSLIKGGFDTANNLINGQIQKNLQSKNHEHQSKLQQQSLEIQDLHHKERIIADAYEQKANRENQFSIAKLNILASQFRDELNRDFQERMKLLDFEEKRLDREQLFQLEEFKAELQIWMQKKQRNIQLEIKQREGKLAKELAEYNRQTQLNLIREGKRISQLPTWIDLQGILGRKNNSGLSTIHIFFSPPYLEKELDSNSSFPKISRSIEKKLEEFINLFRDWDIPVNFVLSTSPKPQPKKSRDF